MTANCQTHLPRRLTLQVEARWADPVWRKIQTQSRTCMRAAFRAGIGTRLDREGQVAAATAQKS
jgi:hypothetical protein